MGGNSQPLSFNEKYHTYNTSYKVGYCSIILTIFKVTINQYSIHSKQKLQFIVI